MNEASVRAGSSPGRARDSRREPVAPSSLHHPLARALLVLTFTTGLIDAVSYLGLGQVFTANMTGNIVFLGFGIAGSGGLPVVAPLVSLGAFLLGAGLGGRLSKRLAELHPSHLSGCAVIALLALAMGVRNATVRRIGLPDLTTTVLTMTLTGLASESPPSGGTGEGSVRRVAAVIAMLTGAIAGALLLKTDLALPLAAAALLALLTWLVYIPAARRAG
jgi:uncharacterized membrane protein YoaK (UPF0700 family)